MSLRSLVLGTKGVGGVGGVGVVGVVGGERVRPQHRGRAAGWMLVALLAAAPGVPGLGASTARAQSCEPVEVAKLLASDGAEWDYFGYSVSVSGNTVVVGARFDDDLGISSGSAYVFEKVGGVWTQQAKLLASDGAADDRFGHVVSVNGDTAVVGAAWHGDLGRDSGSAYVFEKVGSVWTQKAKLLASDGAARDYFGYSVSVSGNTAVVGARGDDDHGEDSGSVYIFEKVGGVWTQQAKLLDPDGARDDSFGWSVSVNDDTAVVGAYADADNGSGSGSVYVFERVGDVWTQQAKLLASDGTQGDTFGHSVSVSDNTVVVGANRDDDNGDSSGSVYVFEKVGGVWTQQAKLLASDGTQDDFFGNSVSVSGDTVMVGATWHDDLGTDSGSAYVFKKVGGVWTQQAKLLASDGAAGYQFGASVSVTGDTAIVGARLDNDIRSGSAYVFDLNCTTCPADLTGDGVVDTRDFVAFLNAWAGSDPLADWDGNGIIDTRDFVAYLNDWVVGCP